MPREIVVALDHRAAQLGGVDIHVVEVDGPLRRLPGDVLVVALEALRARVVGGAELCVVVADRLIEEGAVVGGQLRGVHGLIGQRLTVCIGVGRVGVGDADAQALVRAQPLLLPLELHVVGAPRHPDRCRRGPDSCTRPRETSPAGAVCTRPASSQEAGLKPVTFPSSL